jgi:hypothetical protein
MPEENKRTRVRNASRRSVVTGSGRTVPPRGQADEDLDDPVNAHLVDQGLLVEVKPDIKPKAAPSRTSTSGEESS